MTDNIKIVKKGNYITFTGDVVYNKVSYNSVEVDGKIYKREDREEVFDKVENLNRHYWYDTEWNFDAINYDIVIKNYNGFSYRTLDSMTTDRIIYSNNSEVNSILLAFNNGLLDKRIKYMGTVNKNEYRDFIKYCISNDNEIPIICGGYGWNNLIYYTISTKDFLNSDFNKLSNNLKEILKEEVNIVFKDGYQVKNATNILKYKIKRKRDRIY